MNPKALLLFGPTPSVIGRVNPSFFRKVTDFLQTQPFNRNVIRRLYFRFGLRSSAQVRAFRPFSYTLKSTSVDGACHQLVKSRTDSIEERFLGIARLHTSWYEVSDV